MLEVDGGWGEGEEMALSFRADSEPGLEVDRVNGGTGGGGGVSARCKWLWV